MDDDGDFGDAWLLTTHQNGDGYTWKELMPNENPSASAHEMAMPLRGGLLPLTLRSMTGPALLCLVGVNSKEKKVMYE